MQCKWSLKIKVRSENRIIKKAGRHTFFYLAGDNFNVKHQTQHIVFDSYIDFGWQDRARVKSYIDSFITKNVRIVLSFLGTQSRGSSYYQTFKMPQKFICQLSHLPSSNFSASFIKKNNPTNQPKEPPFSFSAI